VLLSARIILVALPLLMKSMETMGVPACRLRARTPAASQSAESGFYFHPVIQISELLCPSAMLMMCG